MRSMLKLKTVCFSETLVYNTESIRRRNQEQEHEGWVNPAFLMLDRKYSSATVLTAGMLSVSVTVCAPASVTSSLSGGDLVNPELLSILLSDQWLDLII
jgi:hypothetical protein